MTGPHPLQVLLNAITHWYELARLEEQRRDIAVADGWGHPSTYNVRIETYRNAARAIRLELETGEEYCSCHLMTRDERIQKGVSQT